jgi:hypothetical protein
MALAREQSIRLVHELVDRATGEIVGEVRSKPRKGETYGAAFSVLFHRGMSAMMTGDLQAPDYRLYMWLAGAGPTDMRLSWDTWKSVNAADIQAADEGLGLPRSQPMVSRSLVRLVAAGLLEREGRGGGKRAARYRLHENVLWRGGCAPYWHKVAGRRTDELKRRRADDQEPEA